MSNERMVAKMLGPMSRRIGNMLARGVVTLGNAGGKLQRLQVQLLADEVQADVDHVEPYGFTSSPHAGAEVVAAFLDGDRSHGVVIVAGDRRFRMTGLAEGEVAVHDDLGQSVHLTRAGIVVRGGGLPISIGDTPIVTIDSAVHITGPVTADATIAAVGNITTDANVTAAGDVSDAGGLHSARGMREIHNVHEHPVHNVHSGSDSVVSAVTDQQA